jgi:hypothetical protein
MYQADFAVLMENIVAQAVADSFFEMKGGDLSVSLKPEPSEGDREVAFNVVLELMGQLDMRVEESVDGAIDPGAHIFRLVSKWLADEDLEKDTQ